MPWRCARPIEARQRGSRDGFSHGRGPPSARRTARGSRQRPTRRLADAAGVAGPSVPRASVTDSLCLLRWRRADVAKNKLNFLRWLVTWPQKMPGPSRRRSLAGSHSLARSCRHSLGDHAVGSSASADDDVPELPDYDVVTLGPPGDLRARAEPPRLDWGKRRRERVRRRGRPRVRAVRRARALELALAKEYERYWRCRTPRSSPAMRAPQVAAIVKWAATAPSRMPCRRTASPPAAPSPTSFAYGARGDGESRPGRAAPRQASRGGGGAGRVSRGVRGGRVRQHHRSRGS